MIRLLFVPYMADDFLESFMYSRFGIEKAARMLTLLLEREQERERDSDLNRESLRPAA